jgi:hypothetical protein
VVDKDILQGILSYSSCIPPASPMSELVALGVAAAILQFVDFGSKLLVTGYDIYKSHSGAAPQTIHIQTISTELRAISAELSQSPPRDVLPTKREQSLWQLADRAHNIAYHLELLLDSLKLKKSTFKSWGALRQSWRLLNEKRHIDELKVQLDEIKSLVDTTLLILLR